MQRWQSEVHSGKKMDTHRNEGIYPLSYLLTEIYTLLKDSKHVEVFFKAKTEVITSRLCSYALKKLNIVRRGFLVSFLSLHLLALKLRSQSCR